MFDESPIRSTLAHIIGLRASEEVCIRLAHRNFEKRYFIDVLVDSGCPFELKAVSELHDRHRLQMIGYLMLTDLTHGKLINFGGESLEHEFVNCHESTEHRRRFRIDEARWTTGSPMAERFRKIIVELLRDWGTGLDGGLYTEAVTHFFGGPKVVFQAVETLWEQKRVGKQVCALLAPNEAFKITTLKKDIPAYELRLSQFLRNTTLNKIYWVNVISGKVQFVLIE